MSRLYGDQHRMWKRLDLVQDVLPERDAVKARAAGTIGIEEWINKIKSGDPTA